MTEIETPKCTCLVKGKMSLKAVDNGILFFQCNSCMRIEYKI